MRYAQTLQCFQKLSSKSILLQVYMLELYSIHSAVAGQPFSNRYCVIEMQPVVMCIRLQPALRVQKHRPQLSTISVLLSIDSGKDSNGYQKNAIIHD